MSRQCSVWFALTLAVLLTVNGCAKKAPEPAPAPPPPPPATTPPPPPSPPPPPPAPAPQPPAQLSEEEIFSKKTVAELNSERPLADVHFELDSSELSSEARGLLDKNATWLKRWNSVRFTVEGHCDSRGTAEYNLALGERRANAVRGYLTSLGVPADRVISVSKGKEQPVCSEDSDSCWAQNRRGHFIITEK